MLQPKQIPTTGRRADFHVQQLGYNSLKDFATSLPKNAVVADVGAGLSRLGHHVAELRKDITWVNIDPCYKDKGVLKKARENLPPNVTLCDTNIVDGFKAPEELRDGADLVFSYWLLPHLSLESNTPAETACRHMLELLKPTGKLIVGPVRNWGLGLFSPYRYKGTISYARKENPDTAIAEIVSQTKLWWLGRIVQLFSNRHQIHLASKLVGGKSKTA